MVKCLDCGSEVDEVDKYCPNCGSPTSVKILSESDLRRAAYSKSHKTPRKWPLILVLFIILFFLLILIFFIQRMVTSQLEGLSSGFY